MRDPFRPNTKSQLVREAQIGLSVIAILLSLFLYVAFYRISGRGHAFPESVRNLPAAKTVWPAEPRGESRGQAVAMSPKSNFDQRRVRNGDSTESSFNPGGRDVESPLSHARPKIDSGLGFDQNTLENGSVGFGPIDTAVKPDSNPTRTNDASSNAQPSTPHQSKQANKIQSDRSLAERLSSFVGNYGSNRRKPSPAQAIESRNSIGAATKPGVPQITVEATLPPESFSPTNVSPEATGLRLPKFPTSNISSSMQNSDVRLASGLERDSEFESTKTNDTGMRSGSSDVDPPGARSSETKFEPKPLRPSVAKNQPSIGGMVSVLPTPETSRNFLPRVESPQKAADHELSAASSNFNDQNQWPPTAAESESLRSQVAARTSRPLPKESRQMLIQSPVHSALELAEGSGQRRHATEASDEKSLDPTPALVAAQPVAYQPKELPKRIPRPQQAAEENEFSSEAESMLDPANPGANDPQAYTVCEGDNFWSVAEKFYGDGRYFRALYKYNESSTPDFENLMAGTKLGAPSKTDLHKLWPDLCPTAESDLVAGFDGTNFDAVENLYTTQAGETLFEIAGRQLGQKSRYLEIYKLNQDRLDFLNGINEPLPAGVRLVLPGQ